MKRVLVTGGAGYIGSHTCKCLAARGIEPIVFDNLSRGHRHLARFGPLVVADIRDEAAIAAAIRRYRPAAVVHFAAFAYVGESVADPQKYYDNNVAGTLALIAAMRASGLADIVFSSSCAVYGTPARLPITEDMPLAPINPYGASKAMVERIIADCASAYGLRYATLRYFNAAGLDAAGELGEEHDPEPHLIPRALMAAAGRLPVLDVYGDDYPTADGTCVRDFIHVDDLAIAHVDALEKLGRGEGAITVNLGSGRGISVRGIVDAIERVTKRRVPLRMLPRRDGDPAALYADGALAKRVLGFAPKSSDIDTIIRTAWPFFSGCENEVAPV